MSFWKPGNSQPPSKGKDIVSKSGRVKNAKDDIKPPRKSSAQGEKLQSDQLYNKVQQSQKEEKTDIKLSKGTMSMKFMKRKADANQQEKENISKRRKLLESEWSNESGNINVEDQHEQLICQRDDDDIMAAFPGRRSFGGFNSIVEKQYTAAIESSKYEHYLDKNKNNTNEIDDEEMSKRYDELVSLPRGPNQ
eukprot:gene8690-17949_t